MQLTTIVILLGAAVFLVLVFHVEDTQSIYPYTIRGFVADVRHSPLRFIGGLFFKKAFILKKLKLKWKLKKKFVLKKLLKKLFLSRLRWKLGLWTRSPKVIQIFAQYWGYKPPYYRGWSGWSQVPPHFYHQHYHNHHFPFHLKLHQELSFAGRKRRAIRFPDDDGSSLGASSPSSPSHSLQLYDHSSSSGSSSSEAGRTFFDDESYNEFQSIGLGQHELDLLRQLPENLQYEYRQEMQELETSASEPREADIVEYLTVTNEFDTDHCIAKGICEVMSRGNITSNRFENLLLDYYNEEPETRKTPNGSAAYIYDYAAFLGKSRGDSRACASYFPKCPEPTTQLTSFMNEIFSSEMCDPPVTNEL